MSPWFLVAPVTFPVAAGVAMLFLRPSDRQRNFLTELAAVITTVLVWIAIFWVRREPVEVYSFTRGFSIDFRVDGAACLFAGMVSLMWPIVQLYAFSYMKGEKRQNIFFPFYLMTYGVTLGIAFASNMTTMYVFFEMLTLVTLPLVSHYGDHDSMFAGRVYAAYTIGGAALGFFAVVMATVYADAGNFAYGGALAGDFPAGLMRLAFVFGFFGFATKAAIFPLHRWLPAASVAPTPVTALLHAVAVVNAGVFAVMRLIWYTFGTELLIGTWAQSLCLIAAEFTLVYAAAQALRERHFKRRLAYSTVSNLSYMLFGLLLMTPEGLLGGIAHMAIHGITKMLLFLCAGAFMHETGKAYLYELGGAGRRMPVTFGCYTVGALSLTGIPLFAGFLSKWKLFEAAALAATPLGIAGMACLIASAFLCGMYTLTVAARAFFPVRGQEAFSGQERKDAPALMRIPMLVFAAAVVAIGCFPGPFMGFLEGIAYGLR